MSVQTITHTFSSVVGSGGTASANKTIDEDNVLILFVKVEPSIAGGTAAFEIFQKDTLLAADLSYKASGFSGDFIDPVEDVSGVPTERTEGAVTAYQDDDITKELHIKITNDDTTTKNFDITIRYVVFPVSGDVSAAGTPVNNQVAVWTNATTIEGDTKLTWDATTFNITGALAISGAVTLQGVTILDLTSTEAFLVRKDSDGGNVFVVNTTIGQIQAPITGSGAGILIGGDVQWYRSAANVMRTQNDLQVDGQILLQDGTAANPSIGFISDDDGTGTGFYRVGADQLGVTIGGTQQFQWFSTGFRATNTNGPQIINAVASSTVPTLIPRRSDANTGIGSAAADQLSLISGGVEGIRVEAAALTLVHDTTISGDLVVSGAGPHAIGGAVVADQGLSILGTLGAGVAHGTVFNQSVTPATNESAYVVRVTGTLTEFSSGTHAILAGLRIDAPTITAGAAGVTDAGTLILGGEINASGARNHTFLVLSGQSRFGAVGTNDGHVHILSPSTSTTGLVVEMPASSTANAQEWHFNGTNRMDLDMRTGATTLGLITNLDLGNDARGPMIFIGRNNNATQASAGVLGMYDLGGTIFYVHADDTGLLRIGTTVPIGSADTTNGVVGDQTSWHELKNYSPSILTSLEALNKINNLNIYDFTYKDGRYHGESFTGVVGKKHTDWFLKDKGKSADYTTLHGYEILAIQNLAARVAALEAV